MDSSFVAALRLRGPPAPWSLAREGVQFGAGGAAGLAMLANRGVVRRNLRPQDRHAWLGGARHERLDYVVSSSWIASRLPAYWVASVAVKSWSAWNSSATAAGSPSGPYTISGSPAT